MLNLKKRIQIIELSLKVYIIESIFPMCIHTALAVVINHTNWSFSWSLTSILSFPLIHKNTYIHSPGNLAHRWRSARYQSSDTHSGHIHIYFAHCRHPAQINIQLETSWHVRLHYEQFCLYLLTPLLSKQVWLLLGHSQAFPSQPSAHTHLPIMQEPRSVRKEKKLMRLNCFITAMMKWIYKFYI